MVTAVLGGIAFLVAELTERRGCDLPAPQVRVRQEAARELDRQTAMNDARAAMRAGRWADARASFEQALALGEKDLSVIDSLKKCNDALRDAQALDTAEQHIAAGEWLEARYQLDMVSTQTDQLDRLTLLEGKLLLERDRLLQVARALKGYELDRERMQQLRDAASMAERLDADSKEAGELVDLADDALEEIDTPWLPAQREFEEGRVVNALTKAKACARRYPECREMLAPLQVVVPAMAHLERYGNARLLELAEAARKVSDEGPVEDIEQVVVDRYQRAAQACRARGDWLCVDKQLAAAAELDGELDDETLEQQLNAHAADEVHRAYILSGSDPKTARALAQQVAKMTQIESKWKGLATRLDTQLAGP